MLYIYIIIKIINNVLIGESIRKSCWLSYINTIIISIMRHSILLTIWLGEGGHFVRQIYSFALKRETYLFLSLCCFCDCIKQTCKCYEYTPSIIIIYLIYIKKKKKVLWKNNARDSRNTGWAYCISNQHNERV